MLVTGPASGPLLPPGLSRAVAVDWLLCVGTWLSTVRVRGAQAPGLCWQPAEGSLGVKEDHSRVPADGVGALSPCRCHLVMNRGPRVGGGSLPSAVLLSRSPVSIIIVSLPWAVMARGSWDWLRAGHYVRAGVWPVQSVRLGTVRSRETWSGRTAEAQDWVWPLLPDPADPSCKAACSWGICIPFVGSGRLPQVTCLAQVPG